MAWLTRLEHMEAVCTGSIDVTLEFISFDLYLLHEHILVEKHKNLRLLPTQTPSLHVNLPNSVSWMTGLFSNRFTAQDFAGFAMRSRFGLTIQNPLIYYGAVEFAVVRMFSPPNSKQWRLEMSWFFSTCCRWTSWILFCSSLTRPIIAVRENLCVVSAHLLLVWMSIVRGKQLSSAGTRQRF